MSAEVILLTKHFNELDFIEWVKYHLALGFTHITIYNNMSLIPIKDIIQDLKVDNKVTINDIDDYTLKTIEQCGIYNQHHVKSTYDWQLYIDDDEYLWLDPNKYKTVDDFLNTIPKNVNQFGIFWEMISSLMPMKIRTKSSIDTFNYVKPATYQNMIKVFVRKDTVGEFRSPHIMLGNDILCYSAGGIVTSWVGIFNYNNVNDPFKIYHYHVKTKEEWDGKLTRIRADIPRLTYSQTGYESYEKSRLGYIKYDPSMQQMKKLLNI